jgi:hypothetical protein
VEWVMHLLHAGITDYQDIRHYWSMPCKPGHQHQYTASTSTSTIGSTSTSTIGSTSTSTTGVPSTKYQNNQDWDWPGAGDGRFGISMADQPIRRRSAV